MNLLSLCCILPAVLAQQKDGEYYHKVWNENLNNFWNMKPPVRNSDFDITSNGSTHVGFFDYIIVGAGSSGATLAARLAEVPSSRILLLEAGDEEDDFSTMPGAMVAILGTQFSWGYSTVSQENACFGSVNNVCPFPRGKALGGCSSINGMHWIRGSKAEFNYWETLGLTGWNYNNMLPYFKKMENASGVAPVNPTVRGLKGPMTVSYPKPLPENAGPILGGLEDLGYINTDYNDGDMNGKAAILQLTTRHGKRDSVNQAYLKRQCARCRNLTIKRKALVVKIKFNYSKCFSKYVANDVVFINQGKLHTATATKEIIVSAGAVNSPQLLMLSGIGPRKHLQSVGIEPLVNLPVGEYLKDHVAFLNLEITTNLTAMLELDLKVIFDQYAQGKGEMTRAMINEIAFQGINDRGGPIFQWMLNQPTVYNTPEMIFKAAVYKDYMNESLHGQPNSIYLIPMLVDPKSTGNIKLASKDPRDFPKIDPKYLSDRRDFDAFVDTLVEFEKILSTPTFQKIDAKIAPINIPPCEEKATAEERWECIIRHKVIGFFHPTTSCRMGVNPATSVVDKTLRVHGFHNLRVVDLSVVPTTVSAHLNMVGIMLAEKIADAIKDKGLEKYRYDYN